MNKLNHEIIGILGGTFDPIHYGHLRMGQEILESLDLKAIHFIPCYIPVHRTLPKAEVNDRLKMLQIAITNEPRFISDEREIKRAKPSYTVETLESLRNDTPNTTLCLILGIDAFLQFHTWEDPKRILDLAHVIVAHRPTYQLPSEGKIVDFLKNYYSEDIQLIRERKAGSIIFKSITALDISGAMIRDEIYHHKSPRFLLPDNVYEYIKNNSLYLAK